MLVKVGNLYFDSRLQPVMLILAPEEKTLISEMKPEDTCFCTYPQGYTESEIQDFMKTPISQE